MAEKDEGGCLSCDSSAEKLNQALRTSFEIQCKCVCARQAEF